MIHEEMTGGHLSTKEKKNFTLGQWVLISSAGCSSNNQNNNRSKVTTAAMGASAFVLGLN